MKKFMSKKIIVIVIVFIIMCVWLVWGNVTVKRTDVIIESNNLPHEFSGFKIALVSDLHNAEFGDNNDVVINLIKKAEPDIIAITGDLIDSEKIDVDKAIMFVEEIVDIAPCYYVTGNHEAWIANRYEELEARLIQAGVNVLHNEVTDIKIDEQEIYIIGLDDPDFNDNTYKYSSDEELIEDELEKIGDISDFTIVLSHRPELFDVYKNKGIDIVLSGHAHGGQMRIPFIGGLIAPNQGLFPKYDAGVHTADSTSMIVSCGIGNSVIPIRVNNRPEVVIVELKSK